MSSASRTRRGDLEKLQAAVKRMPADVLLALSVMSSREMSARFSRFFQNPDQLRAEVGTWSNLALKIVAEAMETSIAEHRWRPEVEVVAELERVLVAERLTREVEAGDDSED